MASDQVALARIQRMPAGNMSKAIRQSVPPFPQKLYEMVSDTTTDELIRWSEGGDSFFVLDQQRFAHDVLPRWFKHNTFTSFVRQLNMYGFRKIPHLQQGVLRSETETELWNFEHPNFHRGQPDLLCLITRRKQASERHSDEPHIENNGAASTPSMSLGGSSGAVLDINSIISGITAIKRHQTTISADLNDLKTSNQHLWQEAIAARERHKKHQDTINRILKFLAGVFGNSAATPNGSATDTTSHAVIPRKRQRLMIEGRDNSKDSERVGDDDGNAHLSSVPDLPQAEEDIDMLTAHLTTVETPSASLAPSSPPLTATTAPTPTAKIRDIFSPEPTVSPSIKPSDILNGVNKSQSSTSPHPSLAVPDVNGQAFNDASASHSNQTFSPSSLNALAQTSQDTNSDAVLQAILNSPGQLQRLFNAMATQPNYAMPPPSDLPDLDGGPLSQYEHEQDYPFPSQPDFLPLNASDMQSMSLASYNDADSTNAGSLVGNTNQHIQRTLNDTERIDAEVRALSANLNSFIEKMGIADVVPGLEEHDNQQTHHDPAASKFSSGTMNGVSLPPDQDFDFGTLSYSDIDHTGDAATFDFDFSDHLNSMPVTDNSFDTSANQMSAFLDEVTSQSDASSPSATRATLDDPGPGVDSTSDKRGRKRKADAVEVVTSARSNIKLSTGGKSKKKR